VLYFERSGCHGILEKLAEFSSTKNKTLKTAMIYKNVYAFDFLAFLPNSIIEEFLIYKLGC